MFVTERPGNVIIFASAAPGAPRLATIPVSNVHAKSESGLMGLVLDPDFATKGYLYICVSRDDEGEWRNQVLRYRVVGNALIFDSYVIRRGMMAAAIHNGCRIRFGPDGKLWVTMGDHADPNLAQDPNSLHGKILRINSDGTVPPDNPILPGNTAPNAVYTMGHRNPQGIAFQSVTDMPFSMEHAHHRVSETEEHHDTINVLEPGANFGWPEVAGPDSGFDKPAWSSGPVTRYAISGGAFVTGAAWGDWGGHLFVGALGKEALLHFSVAADGTVTLLEMLYSGKYGRLRSPVMGPDGSLYVTTDAPDGMIIRITLAGAAAPRS